MIDTISIPLGNFDLQGFINAYRKFYQTWSGEPHADQSVTIADRFGDVPMPVREERNLIEELTEQGKLLFFQLHEPLADWPALCIDGSREPIDTFDIGIADGYGFLVEVKDGNVHLHPALYDGTSTPIPSVDLQAHCSIMDEKMKAFVGRFVSR